MRPTVPTLAVTFFWKTLYGSGRIASGFQGRFVTVFVTANCDKKNVLANPDSVSTYEDVNL